MVEIRGQHDPTLDAISNSLGPYIQSHANANVVIYRQNSVSVRIRIIDPDLSGIAKADRHDLVWKYLESLPDDIQSDITVLLLLTPEETGMSFANLDFEHPIPSSF